MFLRGWLLCHETRTFRTRILLIVCSDLATLLLFTYSYVVQNRRDIRCNNHKINLRLCDINSTSVAASGKLNSTSIASTTALNKRQQLQQQQQRTRKSNNNDNNCSHNLTTKQNKRKTLRNILAFKIRLLSPFLLSEQRVTVFFFCMIASRAQNWKLCLCSCLLTP